MLQNEWEAEKAMNEREEESLFKKYFCEPRSNLELTIMSTSKQKRLVVNHLGRNVEVNLRVWDTAGMEQYQALMPQYYRATHGFIILYDVTGRDTFEALDRVFNDAETFATIEDHVKILVGNKIDQVKERVVTRAEGLKFAHNRKAMYIEASATNDEAVDHIFEKLVSKVLADCNLWRNTPQEIVRLEAVPPSNNGSWWSNCSC
ncbi:ras-related protein Rab-18-B-like isoform X2 [Ischnura elegans]|uniref:ras-related protein Rab-18-B-like isoform X2 n=1 Tax=Ischnura elegans TaxID=197161 RepID=UPI001ED86770|nr:ras-related protein Rab-18-B-like isoform X2 [Ischnura elegans]